VPLFQQLCEVNASFTREFSPACAKWLTRHFPLIVLEHCQGQGPEAYEPRGPAGYRPRKGYIDGHYIAAAAELKRLNRSTTILYYQNMDAALPFFRYSSNIAMHPKWRVSGRGSTGGSMFPNLTTYIWDHSNDEVQRTFLSTFLNLTDAGSPLDGTFVDTAEGEAPAGRAEILARMQSMRPNKLVGFHTADIPSTYSLTQIYNFDASESKIDWLRRIATSPTIALVHAQTAFGTCEQCGHVHSALAAFLIGAGERSYFAFSAIGDAGGPGSAGWEFCAPHSPADPIFPTWCTGMGWSDDFLRPLGPPLADAERSAGGIWRRRFATGTNVSVDTGRGECRIDWAVGPATVCAPFVTVDW